MSALPLAAVFASAFLHASWNAIYGLSRGAGLLLVWPLSLLFFGEQLDLRAVAGALLLSLGLFALVTRAQSRAGLWMAAACAVTIAFYPVTYKQALLRGVAPFPLFATSLAIAFPIQLALLGERRVERLRSAWRARPLRLLLGAALCAASFLLFLVALQSSGAGRMTGLRNTSVLFAAVFGWLAGEPLTRRSLASALAITMGAVVLSWT